MKEYISKYISARSRDFYAFKNVCVLGKYIYKSLNFNSY